MSIEYPKITTGQLSFPEGKSRYLLFFVMLTVTIMLSKEIFSYRLVEISGHIIQAGQLISPIWFLLCDMISEIYGYAVAKKTIFAGFLCQILFTLICTGLNKLPFPLSWHEYDAYQIVIGDLWRVNIAVLFAFVLAGIINVNIITRWKALLHGKHFWLRSIGASIIAELLFSFLATLIIQYGKQSIHIIITMILLSFLLKIIYAIILATPANLIVYLIKKAEHIEEQSLVVW